MSSPLADVDISVPEPGNIVEARGATWAVTEVYTQGLPHSPADDLSQRQHLVTLQSLEEDRMGEEISVIWELEVGNAILPDRGIPTVPNPDAFDDPNTLGAFVDAVRWGAVTSADSKRYQSPFRTGANLEAYQLEPLRRALAAPRTNLLLADDVGLGKTIEAGMVVQELLIRHRARSVIVVCPPSLSLKWQDEMQEKFGLDFVIVDSDELAHVRRTYGLASNPFRIYPRVIVSMAWIAKPRAQRMLREVYDEAESSGTANRYSFDVLVVDEAHHVAPAAPSGKDGSRGYAVDSQRTLAVGELAKHCEHRLFLSATPHNGYTESFTALLEMIDSRRFARGAQIDKGALEEVCVRRLKGDVKSDNFSLRAIKTLKYRPSDDEVARYNELSVLLKASARQAGKDSLDIGAMILKKRFLSSPYSFGRTMQNYDSYSMGSQTFFDEGYYREVLGSDQSDEEEGREEQSEYETLRRAKSDGFLSAATDRQVSELSDWGLSYDARPDSKLLALVGWLDGVCRPDGQWSDERVVIFTEYADTLHWIVEVLRSRGYAEGRLEVIEGSTDPDEREIIRSRFNSDPSEEPVRVLVATDAAGEGIDLQGYCHRLVNYDVPFNPSRLEQRIGRIDRYGQRETSEIFYFASTRRDGAFYADAEFMERLAQKVANQQEDLVSINPIIDGKVIAHFTGRLTRGTRKDRDASAIDKVLRGEQGLRGELDRLVSNYDDSRLSLHLTQEAEARAVNAALEFTGQPSLVETGEGTYRLPEGLNPNWSRTVTKGLDTTLNPGVWRPITFDGERARSDGKLAYIHLGSSLMQASCRTLRGNLYSQESRLRRVTAVMVPGLEGTQAAAISRLVLVGRGGMRVHEEVFVTGVRFRGANVAQEKAQALLDSMLDARAGMELAPRDVRQWLVSRWDDHLQERLERAVEQRAETLKSAVQEDLEKREGDEVMRVEGIFAAFRANLEDSLASLRDDEFALFMQPQLWGDDQKRQRERDIRAMEDRLSTLGEEERRELDAVAERYRDIKPYVTIAALAFAVSPEDAAEWRA